MRTVFEGLGFCLVLVRYMELRIWRGMLARSWTAWTNVSIANSDMLNHGPITTWPTDTMTRSNSFLSTMTQIHTGARYRERLSSLRTRWILQAYSSSPQPSM